MKPITLTMVLGSIGLGTTITFASSHWILAWMGLEITTLAILPLMIQEQQPRMTEATTKYFMTQATAAAMLLFATLTNAWLLGQWQILQTPHPLSATLITVALAMKMGLAPVHSWLPEVLQGLELRTGLIVATWQKLAPFALLIQIQTVHPALLIFFGITSILVGGLGGLNQTQLRKILAYSSISHLGWIIIALQFSTVIATLTLIIYIIMTTTLFIIFSWTNSKHMNRLALVWAKAPILTALTTLLLLSLGGLPPLIGFMPKWLILAELVDRGYGIIATAVALFALFSMYIYLRIAYYIAKTMAPQTIANTADWEKKNNPLPTPLSMLIATVVLSLPLTPTIASMLSF